MKKILIIEDDIWISQSLKIYLENSDFEVVLHTNWSDALTVIEKQSPDLIILDINLPWKSWIDICKEYRIDWNLPIVMLTARSSELDRIIWLEIWADDYIAKPFSPRELLARINTILRRSSWSSVSTSSEWLIKYNNIEIDTHKKVAKIDWKNIWLTWNEYDIFKKVIESDGNIVSRETIMKEIIWYENYVYDRTIDTHIKNIRKKIWPAKLILTVRWEWYRLNK